MTRPIAVVDYDPAWPSQFRELCKVLATALGELAIAIEHIGSTSVPGLAAKPILDIDVVIATRGFLPPVVERLAALGYRHKGDRGIDGREAFDWGAHEMHQVPLDGSGRRWPEHHLYVCARDNPSLRVHLAFRDRLIGHADERDAYATLKRELAARFKHDRVGYLEHKTEFIEKALARAGPGHLASIATKRLRLRPIGASHTEAYAALLADPAVYPFAIEDGPADPSTIAGKIRAKQAAWAEGTGATWALMLTGQFIGYISLHGLDAWPVAVSYSVNPSHHRRGFGREALQAILNVTPSLDADVVEARTHHHNQASAGLLVAVGFQEVEACPDPPRRVFRWWDPRPE